MVKSMFAILLLLLNFQEDISSQNADKATRTIPFDDTFELVVTNEQYKQDRLNVKYEVVEKDIYVECFVKDFTFVKGKSGMSKKDGEGHIQLFINDQKVDSIFTSSFIIKAMPAGTYEIKIDLVHNDYSPYGVSEKFEVKL